MHVPGLFVFTCHAKAILRRDRGLKSHLKSTKVIETCCMIGTFCQNGTQQLNLVGGIACSSTEGS